MAIKINYHNHLYNSGLGNKLFLNFLARALSLQNNEPLCNWLNTKIYAGVREAHTYKNVAGVKKDNWGLLWPYSSCEEKDLTILGEYNNVERFYGSDFHQSCNTINLISKYKTQLIKDFGEKRDCLFTLDLEIWHKKEDGLIFALMNIISTAYLRCVVKKDTCRLIHLIIHLFKN